MSAAVWYFGADWCKTCHLKRPLVEQACQEHGVAYKYYDVADPDMKLLAEDLMIRSIPMVLVLRDADEVYRGAGGLINEPALVAAIRRARAPVRTPRA